MEAKINALITLLDDTDAEVVAVVSQELMQLGTAVVPTLQDIVETHANPLVQERLAQIIDDIQFEVLLTDFKVWLKSPNHDLFYVAMAIVRYQYPNVDEVEMRNKLETMRIEAWVRLNPDDAPENKVAVVNEILFGKYHFSGNAQQYYDSDNSFLNKVIETRRGNPVSLCVIYMIIAQKLGMSVFGVNLPEHFVLAYLNEAPENVKLPIEERPILFYINPFNNGIVFKEKEITQFLSIINAKPEKKYYQCCNNILIANRIVNNLIRTYQTKNELHKVNHLQQIQELMQAYL